MNKDQQTYDVMFEWGTQGLEAFSKSADVAVIVDVLSFSTAVSVGIEQGVTIIPCLFNSKAARQFAKEKCALLAVERRHSNSEHPYSLSPASLKGLPSGSRLVLPSPNGSACCARATELGLQYVLVGCLRNASATAAAAKSLGTRVLVIAAGERWPDGGLRPAIEDYIGAGAIISFLQPHSPCPEAAAAMWSYEASKNRIKELISGCISGQELIGWNYGQDVEAALEMDVSPVAAVLREGEITGLDLQTTRLKSGRC